MSRHLKNQKGFTLIELLIALGIVAVLVTLLYESFNAVLRSTERVDEAAEIHQMARISLGLMTRELRSAYWRSSSPTGPAGNVASTSDFSFNGQDGEGGGKPSDSLQFTALSHARAAEGIDDPSLSDIAYELVAVPETGTAVLMHTEQTNRLSDSDQSLEEFELAERVVGLNFRYYDGKTGNWVDSWSAAEMTRLPTAVQIQIFFKDALGRERQFTTQTDIPLGQKT